MNKIFSNRCVISLLTASIILVIRLSTSSSTYEGLPPESFWKSKLQQTEGYQIIVAGDSRIYRGISPDTLTKATELPKVINFGFSSVGYESNYLDAVENLVHAHLSPKIIILGISPYSLTPKATEKNGFHDAAHYSGNRLSKLEIRLDEIKSQIPPKGFDPFRQWVKSALRHNLRPAQEEEKIISYNHKNGWSEVKYIGTNTNKTHKTYEYYKNIAFNKNFVSHEIIESLLQRIHKWREYGYRVFAFRPPTTDRMEQIENMYSDFDERLFAKQFKEHGGIWLDIDEGGLSCYDGSHLDGLSAIKFSHRLGHAIHQYDFK
jgi:hypothetical protein